MRVFKILFYLLAAWRKITIVAPALAVILLAGCVNTQTKPPSETVDRPASMAQIEKFITKTEALGEPARTNRTLGTAEFLFENHETDWAQSVVETIDVSATTANQFIRLLTLKAKLALKDGEPYIAKRFLFHPRGDQELPLTQVEYAAIFIDMRATLLFDQADFISSVDERLALNELIQDDELRTQLNHDLIWETLAELPTDTLFSLSKTEKNELKQGWLSLAALSKSNGTNFRRQIEDINGWRETWPSHPANSLLPADLQLILQLADEQAQNIALFLPLSGKLASAGNAIKEGALAAYYDDISVNPFAPKITVYDTYNRDIDALYKRAVGEGAELIIGPLSKENVSRIYNRDDLTIPTLALNTRSSDNQDSTAKAESAQNKHNFFQFSLAVEGEARQVANKAWTDGHRRALIVAPMSSWGDRGISAFKNEWEKLGGIVVDDKRYKDQRSYSPLIEASVSVDQSKQRHREMQRLLGSRLAFEPRRRKDIDFIFLLSYSPQAQQIKPLLAFHYAGDIPVYATSQVYPGRNGKGLSDLNGVRFSTLPWFFDDALNERRAIQAYGDGSANFQALYALGVDAYHIYPRLEQLQKIRQAKFYGSTGRLNLSERNAIERIQAWAEIVAGKAVEIKKTATEESEI